MAAVGKLNSVLSGMFLLLAISCQQQDNEKNKDITGSSPQISPVKAAINVPVFNSDSAYSFIRQQVNFGPRVPGSKAHAACATYLENKLTQYAFETSVQQGTITAFDGKQFRIKNIIGSYNPSSNKRYLLCSHWDTRPFADQDTENPTRPNEGANDGASGVGVLLEMARLIDSLKPGIGIDIIFFDFEDYAKETEDFCLGSKYWSENPHVPGYNASFGVLLDMVGAPGATFLRDNTSEQYASHVLDIVWNTAAKLGYGNYFMNTNAHVYDDHYYVNTIRGIPTIDIIHMNPNGGFGDYWHRHSDNMNSIDRSTLKAVGQTLLHVLLNQPINQ